MRETVYALDGSELSWEAQGGEVFFELVSADMSRSFRWVMEPEQVAAILRAALLSQSGVVGVPAGRLLERLDSYLQYTDAMGADR